MKVLDPGHCYELNLVDGGPPQTIQFIDKRPEGAGSQRLITAVDGTTNEEVLAMLIDRMYWLQNLASCRENSIVITKLEECLMWLNKRTADRIARHVESTSNK